ncbi:MAG: DUF134 domain-containing protein [Promethearchaeota archaeon]
MLKIPRPKNKRTIRNEPGIQYFNPQRNRIIDNPIEELSFDELEAMRLKHLLGKTQDECARLMDISQSTFSRILDHAHSKITSALVEGKTIHLIGGDYSVKEYYYGYGCMNCGHEWEIELDKQSIPLELNKDDMTHLLPSENINCTNTECKSSNIYRLIRDVMR